MSKKRLFTGLTSTGKLTLGNYLGSLNNLKKLQKDKENEVILFVADLHALSIPLDPKVLANNVKENLKLYLASGFDYKETKIYLQSQIPMVNELFYLLSTLTTIGQLNRMTQFKDKAQKQQNQTSTIPTGILLYPIMMAADIILFNPDFVVVGSDQKQHLEFARDLILKLNKNYHTTFKVTEPLIAKISEGAKIMALKNPTEKMSKSDKNKDNTIYLLDKLEDVKKKILNSLTDNENKIYYNLDKKPGVSNLLTIYSSIKNITIKEAELEFKDLNDYRKFKEIVAEAVLELLEKIQKKYLLLKDSDLNLALEFNLNFLKEIANQNLKNVKQKMGILN